MAYEERSPLRLSLFPNVPPFIRVLPPGIQYNPPLPQVNFYLTPTIPYFVLNNLKNFSTHFSSSSASLPSSTSPGACPVQLCGSRRHQPHHRWVCQRGRIHPRWGQSTFSNISGIFGCDSISSTFPGESIGPLVTDTFRFSLEFLEPPWVFFEVYLAIASSKLCKFMPCLLLDIFWSIQISPTQPPNIATWIPNCRFPLYILIFHPFSHQPYMAKTAGFILYHFWGIFLQQIKSDTKQRRTQ